MRLDAAARTVLGAAVLAFLVVGDVGIEPAWPWHLARLAALGLALAAAAVNLAARPAMLGALARRPLAFFTVFAGLDLVASACAAHPLPALRYATGFVAVEILAVATAAAFTQQALLVGLLATLVAKLGLSIALSALPLAWWFDTRFVGVYGNPNPLGAAAGLAYLLIVLHGWYHWPRNTPRVALAVLGFVAAATMAFSRSRGAIVATLATLAVLTPIGRVRSATPRQRVVWAAVALAMLAPLVVGVGERGGGAALVLGAGPVRDNRPVELVSPAESINLRADWWSRLGHAVWQRPWLGYGAGSTPTLGIPGAPPWGSSAHNLYLEAAIYAGIPAAIAMAAFMLATLVTLVRPRRRPWRQVHPGLAIPVVFYTVLSFGEPVVLNAAPSSLVVLLVAAAACAARFGSCSDPGDGTPGTSASSRASSEAARP
jgi:O-antigen ligase